MLCEKCNEREANVEYTEIIGGVKSTHHYCLQCLAELQMDLGSGAQILEGEFPLSKLLSSLLSMKIGGDKSSQDVPRIACPTCHTTYEEFIKNSRFGCPDCYNVFDLMIGDNIRQLQGADSHKGKHPRYSHGMMLPESEVRSAQAAAAEVPVQSGKTEKLIELRRLLADAVSREEFEDAARYRDEIRALEEASDE